MRTKGTYFYAIVIPWRKKKKTASAVLLGVGSAEGVKRYFEGISQKYCGGNLTVSTLLDILYGAYGYVA